METQYLYYDFEDVVVKIEKGRYFLKFKGKKEQECFTKISNLLCDILLDSNKKYLTKEEYDNF